MQGVEISHVQSSSHQQQEFEGLTKKTGKHDEHHISQATKSAFSVSTRTYQIGIRVQHNTDTCTRLAPAGHGYKRLSKLVQMVM